MLMFHKSIKYVIAYTVWHIVFCILSRLLDHKTCQRARTQKHICPVLPQAEATEPHDSRFQRGSSNHWWCVSPDPSTHYHPVPCGPRTVNLQRPPCKVRSGFWGICTDNWLPQGQSIPVPSCKVAVGCINIIHKPRTPQIKNENWFR